MSNSVSHGASMKVVDLDGVALDYWVAIADGWGPVWYVVEGGPLRESVAVAHPNRTAILGYAPSTDWSLGGPIIERKGITLRFRGADLRGRWSARAVNVDHSSIIEVFGPAPLIAAMRCFVGSRFGEEVHE